MHKKAIIGVEILIIFIVMILVASVATGVILRTGNVLQQKALVVGQQTRSRITQRVDMVTVAATDGQDGDIEHFEILAKLGLGSDPVDLNKTYIRFVSDSYGAVYKYSSNGTMLANGEKNYAEINSSYIPLHNDLDDDYIDDSFMVYNQTHLVFNLTGTGLSFVRVGDISSPIILNISTQINYSNVNYGTLIIEGNTTIANKITGANIVITPSDEGIGTFKITYLKTSRYHRIGKLFEGDAVKIEFIIGYSLGEEKDIHISLLVNNGAITTVDTVVPSVLLTNKVILYP